MHPCEVRSLGARCTRGGTVLLTTGCKHEHVSTNWSCAQCASVVRLGRARCRPCWRQGCTCMRWLAKEEVPGG